MALIGVALVFVQACATQPVAAPSGPPATQVAQPAARVDTAVGDPARGANAASHGPASAEARSGVAVAEPSSATTPAAAETDTRVPNLWETVRGELRLRRWSERPEVRDAIRAYARDRDIARVFTGRGALLLPLVVAEARARGMPVELAFLPFVESKLNPVASNAGNVGMWQFQAATARLLGLQTGPGIDERKDPVRSTRAAYTYLARLHRLFDGDWMLALTAYNIGDGRLRQLLAGARSRDVWQLPLPAHTRIHLARLAALWEIARDPRAAGVTLPTIADGMLVAPLRLDAASTAEQLASRTGFDARTLATLNAHLGGGRWSAGTTVWVPDTAPHPLPTIASAEPSASSTTIASTTMRGTPYRVAAGDTLSALARRFRVSVGALKATNALDDDALQIGDELLIPRD